MKVTAFSIALSLFGTGLSAPVSDNIKDTEPSLSPAKDTDPALLYGSWFNRLGTAARFFTVAGDKNGGGLERRASDEELVNYLFGTFTPRLLMGNKDVGKDKRDELERRISSTVLKSLALFGDEDGNLERRASDEELANYLFGTFTPRLIMGDKELAAAQRRSLIERGLSPDEASRASVFSNTFGGMWLHGDGEPTKEKREELERRISSAALASLLRFGGKHADLERRFWGGEEAGELAKEKRGESAGSLEEREPTFGLLAALLRQQQKPNLVIT